MVEVALREQLRILRAELEDRNRAARDEVERLTAEVERIAAENKRLVDYGKDHYRTHYRTLRSLEDWTEELAERARTTETRSEVLLLQQTQLLKLATDQMALIQTFVDLLRQATPGGAQ
ncbi:MAG: hypothetical protein ACTHU0_18345 [Kofleriaceae bacterium]